MPNIFRLGGGGKPKRIDIIKNGILQNGYAFTATVGSLSQIVDGLNWTATGRINGTININNPITLDTSKTNILCIEIKKIYAQYSYLSFNGLDESFNAHGLSHFGDPGTTFKKYILNFATNTFDKMIVENHSGTFTLTIKNLYFMEIESGGGN